MKIAAVSYNPPDSPYTTGIEIINGQEVLILGQTFAFPQKGRQSVRADDKNFLILLEHKETLEDIFVFAGKKDSGALEIIELFTKHFDKNVLFFVLCDHDKKEKVTLLNRLGFKKTQWMSFMDGFTRCREWWILMGLVHARISRTFYAKA